MNKVKGKNTEIQLLTNNISEIFNKAWRPFYKNLQKSEKSELVNIVYDAMGTTKNLFERSTVGAYMGNFNMIPPDKKNYWIKLIFTTTIQALKEKADRQHQANLDTIDFLETSLTQAYATDKKQ